MTDEVVVSANRNEVSRKAAPVVVNVMSAKLFEMVNSTDLAKTLNYQSGLRVENNCQNCGFPQVRINGLEGPYSQILINSRPVISALSGVYGLEQIPVNMIERVRGGKTRWRFGAVRRQCCGRNYQYHHQRPHQQLLPGVEHVLQHGRQVLGSSTWAGTYPWCQKTTPDGIALYRKATATAIRTTVTATVSPNWASLNMNTFGFRAYSPSHAFQPYQPGVSHHQRVPPRRQQVRPSAPRGGHHRADQAHY